MEINNTEINEEIFCLNFELKTLAELYCYNDAERWVYKFMSKNIENEHLKRYQYVLQFVKNKNVLDIACGAGYGSYLLAAEGNANSVIGVDMDADAIRYGNHRYKNDKIVRHIADATHFTHSIKFDVIVCFETIEHIKDYQGLINNLYNNLNVGGLLLISSPITKITNTNPNNPYHVIEWNFYDFQNLFLEKFKVKEILLQNIILNRFRMNVIFKLVNKVFRYLGFSNLISNIVQGKDFEVYTNQYNMNLCDSGYQMLVLEKL